MAKQNILNELEWYSHQNINTTFKEIAKNLKGLKGQEKIPSIAEIANASFTTPSSITRFCVQLGYDGFKELINRLFIEFELFENKSESIKNDKWTSDIVYNNAFENDVKVLRRINDNEFHNVLTAAQLLSINERVYLVKDNELGYLTDYFYQKLLFLGVNVYLISSPKNGEKLLLRNLVPKNSVFFAITKNANLPQVNELFNHISLNDQKTAVICCGRTLFDFENAPDALIKLENSGLSGFYVVDKIVKLMIQRK